MSLSTPPRFNFLRGHPNPSLLPTREMSHVLQQLAMEQTQQEQQEQQQQEQATAGSSGSVSPSFARTLNYLNNDRGDPVALQALRDFIDRQTAEDELPFTTTTTTSSTSTSSSLSSSSSSLSLFWTHGVSHGLDLLCNALHCQQGDVVLLQRPTYFLAADMFRQHGLTLQALPTINNGTMINVAALKELLQQQKQQQQQQQQQQQDDTTKTTPATGNIKFLYLIPTHHNPTAHTLSLRMRQELVTLARQFNFWIVADEVYHLLDWRQQQRQRPQPPPQQQQQQEQQSLSLFQDHRRPARMAVVGAMTSRSSSSSSRDNNNNNNNNQVNSSNSNRQDQQQHQQQRYHDDDNPCISVSSFTKIFCPGIRLGWIEACNKVMEALVNVGYIKSQGGCAPFMGDLMRVALSQGICDDVLANLNAAYQKRSMLLCNVLTTESRIHIHQIPLGGYFVWISFDGIEDTNEFLPYCRERGVGFLPGRRCGAFGTDNVKDAMDDNDCRQYARLCFADMDVADLETGAKLLVQCYRDYVVDTLSTNRAPLES